MKRNLICLLILGALLLTGCTGGQVVDGPGMVNSYTQITQEEAKQRMLLDDGHLILDVRRQDEYDAGHIPGAVCLPNEDIGPQRPEMLPDPDQILLVYCRSGRRSKEAAQKLFDLGYTNVYEFGGIIDWDGEIETETVETDSDTVAEAIRPTQTLVIEVNGATLYAGLEDNAAAQALIELLSPGPLELSMADDGGFAKVGTLPQSLPTCDEQITTAPGDITLCEGNQLSICYAENTWELTRLGSIYFADGEVLKELLGDGDVTVTLWLEFGE